MIESALFSFYSLLYWAHYSAFACIRKHHSVDTERDNEQRMQELRMDPQSSVQRT